MPGLPGRTSTRNTSTPRAKSNGEDDWVFAFNNMGSEPLNSGRSTVMATASKVSPPSSAYPSLAQGSEKNVTILDLPLETQKEIFKYSSTPDLVCLALVSKHFRAIATEHLYRTFHIVFPDEDDPSNDVPIDGLAGGLDTFVTSDYNYAKHLREIVLESLSGGAKGERAYRHYQYDVSCGKFMNTLLLLTLRKAKSLETFKWDIRVELSREVFRTLHGIRTLQHLHLRMQAGHSIYQAPPAIHGSHTQNISTSISMLAYPPHSHSVASFMLPPESLSTHLPNPFSLVNKLPSHKFQRKNLEVSSAPIAQAPATLSGFKELKKLAILDLDTLEYASEIKACISNCASTLTSLKLSFSDALSNQTRKPLPEMISDDESDQESEFQVGLPPGMPPPPGQGPSGGVADPNGPSKAIQALEQKKNQEVFLAKIFGMDSTPFLIPNASPSTIIDIEPEVSLEALSIVELRNKFLKTLSPIFSKLFSSAKDNCNAGPGEADVFEIMRKFAEIQDTYGKPKEIPVPQQAGSLESSTAKGTPESSIDGHGQGQVDLDGTAPGGGDEPGLFDEPTAQNKKKVDPNVSNPEDVDINEPEIQELVIDSELAASEPPVESTEGSGDVHPELASKRAEFLERHVALQNTAQELLRSAELLKNRVERLKANFYAGKSAEDPYAAMEIEAAEELYTSRKQTLDEVEHTLQELGDQVEAITNGQTPLAHLKRGTEMGAYVRKTRGLTLKSLAIYLIPVKPSVLSKAVDLSLLRSITLLNVGIQTPFWNHMARHNNISPLPLHKIHTDNITLPFLSFVSQLNNLTELFLLERTAKAKVETMTTKTTVTIDHIRRLVLKRHAATLKILMIRHDASQEWDMNVKTAMLLCQRAKALEELAISFGVRTMHTLLQFMPGLISLRALHAIKFRTNDQCMWVLQEFRRFTADNVSHNPHLKLEYVAVDISIDRIIRRVPKKKTDSKGKEVATKASSEKTLSQLLSGSASGGAFTSQLDMTAFGSVSLDESENEDAAEWGVGINGKTGLKVETMEGLQFCDVTGVTIFEKEIIGGRL